jgi:hypothetical protein
MNEMPSDVTAGLVELPCSCLVYRAILRKTWIDEDTGHLKSAAFIRRPGPGGDVGGLSVGIAATYPLNGFISSFKKCYAVVSLHVGRVRNIGLDVKPDSYTHANIIGLPYAGDDPAEAERFAGLLAKQSRFQWRR